jgi:hypothetical protein
LPGLILKSDFELLFKVALSISPLLKPP